MLSAKEVLSLTDLASPLLTAYVETDPLKEPVGKSVASVTWLRQEAKSVAENLPSADKEKFHKQVSRTEEFLTDRRPKEKGIVILAGPTTWKLFPLQLKVENELHWGKPALSQLLSLLNEERPSLIVAIDRGGARLFRYAFGEVTEYFQSKFEIDSSQWKRKEHAHMARRATEMPHGNQRDAFKQRMDAQYLHVCREVAKRATALAKQEKLASIFLVGSKRLTEPLEAALPQRLRDNVTLIAEELARVSPGVIQKHIRSVIAARANEDAARRVDRLIEGSRGTVVSVDETLAKLQSGGISTLVVARGFDPSMKQCVKCGLVNRSGDPVCAACGSQRRSARLSEILPELLRRHKTELDVVNGEAGERLRAAGGMGGSLRPPRSKEAS
jgi:hypothetical protein